jgi:hypothetical protein
MPSKSVLEIINSPKIRIAEIKRLSDQANNMAALLSVAHILSDDSRQSVLLDCSSMADDFARDLDRFVATRVPE